MTRIGLFLAAATLTVQGQPQPVVLSIEVENSVMYFDDVGDPRAYSSTIERRVLSAGPQESRMVHLADIVAVNGKPARGIRIQKGMQISYRPDPGDDQQAVADVIRSSVVECHYEILNADGTLIGHIMTLGHNSGPIAPGMSTEGSPSGSWAIVGGTGAFIGVHGQSAFYPGAVGARFTTMSESAKMRRTNGGGSARYLLYLYPSSRPEIVSFEGRPSIFHSDFTLVTPSRPAHAGEVLILRAANLGPTKTYLPPGQRFPVDKMYEVNSPIEVSMDRKDTAVINKIGWPGTTSDYRIDFLVPDGTAAGMVPVQLSAAWIPGPEALVPVR